MWTRFWTSHTLVVSQARTLRGFLILVFTFRGTEIIQKKSCHCKVNSIVLGNKLYILPRLVPPMGIFFHRLQKYVLPFPVCFSYLLRLQPNVWKYRVQESQWHAKVTILMDFMSKSVVILSQEFLISCVYFPDFLISSWECNKVKEILLNPFMLGTTREK